MLIQEFGIYRRAWHKYANEKSQPKHLVVQGPAYKTTTETATVIEPQVKKMPWTRIGIFGCKSVRYLPDMKIICGNEYGQGRMQ
jgi:hypothetical protein